MNNIILYLLQGIPEMMGIIALSLALGRVSLRWKLILVIGVVLASAVYIIRSLDFTFGIHTFASAIIIVIIISKYTTLPTYKCFIFVISSFITLALLELIIHEPVFMIMKLEPKEIMSNSLLWTSLGLCQAFAINCIAIMVSKYIKPIEGAWKR